LGLGGSTRCRYTFQAAKQNIAGVLPSTDADIENLLITMNSGSFDEEVGVVLTCPPKTVPVVIGVPA
jgi:hypothetical protein